MQGTLNTVALPLLPPVQTEDLRAPRWNDLAPVSPLPEVVHSPLADAEPIEPQGAYNDSLPEAFLYVPLVDENKVRQAELLAPAGGPEAGYAAFHFGADAIYLGLQKFSARAEAENFTRAEVDEITAYAHSLEPRRRVFVTVNTLVRQDELPELIDDIAALAEIGVDALIIQDLGVYHLVHRYFPELELHASTQLSVHNRAGAETLKRLGFTRAVLARELTFEEVRDITAASGIETEVFIHGALCYSYSGLCLFSAQTLGRSGNRGKCAYSCRDAFEVSGAPMTLRDGDPVKRDPSVGFPFSMKDLALPDHIPALRAAGVSCFKVEGRKKSPLYVATTTEYYRKLIDGTLAPDERPKLEADMQTVFSRPWTRLFVQSHKDKEVADRDTVGHRGTLIGKVEAVVANEIEPRLRFRTNRTLERHDGLQIDLPTLGKPFGFAVEKLWLVRKGHREEVFEAGKNSVVEVSVPRDHPPLPVGAPVYCSSSQAVKQQYRHERPKPGQYRSRRLVVLDALLTVDRLSVEAHVLPIRRGEKKIVVTKSVSGPFARANDRLAMEMAARKAFARLGNTSLELNEFSFHNEEACFVPVSQLNELRRQLTADLESALSAALAARVANIKREACVQPTRTASPPFRWSIKVDRIDYLDALQDRDLEGVEDVIVDIARDQPMLLGQKLDQWSNRIGRNRLRLALPALTRSWEEKGLRHKIETLRAAGWNRWEAANLSAWQHLGIDPLDPKKAGIDLATDWSVYVINRLAAHQVLGMGANRFALSPEDGVANIRSLAAEFGPQAVLIVYQDTPLFLAESCAYANLIGGCPGKANCNFESMEMVSTHGEKCTAIDYHCRTIVLNHGPFCLSARLPQLADSGVVSLRADFIYRKYEPAEVRRIWQMVRAGKPVPGGHAANFDRGIL